mgnify:CR=1 FL=1
MKEFSKVFILDNVKLVRSRIQLLLNTEDLHVIEASNSSEFFNVFLQNASSGNLIIMDIELMAEDGFQVIKKIRNINKDIPILILTANNNRGILNKIISEGAQDYILKPFKDLQLKDKVNNVLISYSNLENINTKICNAILNNKEELSKKILSRHFFYQPDLKLVYMYDNYKEYLNAISSHLTYLSEALSLNNLLLYNDYITWEKSLINDLYISTKNISIKLNCIKDILDSELSKEMSIIVNCFIDAGIKNLLFPITSSKTLTDKNNAYHNILVGYLQLVFKIERVRAGKLIMDTVEKGISIKDIYVYVFEPCLIEIGSLWQANKITIAQEHYFTETTQSIMSELCSKTFPFNKNGFKFVATCVSEESHVIGIKMVSNILELDGWDTYYLGSDVPRKDLISFLIDVKPHVIGISVTIILHVHKVIELIHAIRNIEELKDIKILVGGYPFNIDKDLWKQVGADFYAPNAIETSDLLCNVFNNIEN